MGLWNLKRINDLYNHIRKTYSNPALLRDSKWQLELVKKALKVEEVRLLLKGKKTYLVAVLMAALAGLEYAGFITPEIRNQILILLNGIGLASLRAGVTTETKRN